MRMSVMLITARIPWVLEEFCTHMFLGAWQALHYRHKAGLNQFAMRHFASHVSMTGDVRRLWAAASTAICPYPPGRAGKGARSAGSSASVVSTATGLLWLSATRIAVRRTFGGWPVASLFAPLLSRFSRLVLPQLPLRRRRRPAAVPAAPGNQPVPGRHAVRQLPGLLRGRRWRGRAWAVPTDAGVRRGHVRRRRRRRGAVPRWWRQRVSSRGSGFRVAGSGAVQPVWPARGRGLPMVK